MIEITIGIPTYNRPELLARLLKELLQQTHSKFFIYISVNINYMQNNRLRTNFNHGFGN
jgi:glycosyltransferase involved in cell wall biosynthesis